MLLTRDVEEEAGSSIIIIDNSCGV
jgi:hypothetical protein